MGRRDGRGRQIKSNPFHENPNVYLSLWGLLTKSVQSPSTHRRGPVMTGHV